MLDIRPTEKIGEYELVLPDGRKNYYRYKDGQLSEVELYQYGIGLRKTYEVLTCQTS